MPAIMSPISVQLFSSALVKDLEGVLVDSTPGRFSDFWDKRQMAWTKGKK